MGTSRAQTRLRPTPWPRSGLMTRRRVWAYVFIAIPVIWLFVFSVGPILGHAHAPGGDALERR